MRSFNRSVKTVLLGLLATSAFMAATPLTADAQRYQRIPGQTITGSDNCKNILFTNNTDHIWQVNYTYHYKGKMSDGTDHTYDWFAGVEIYPRSTAKATIGESLGAGLIDCNKIEEFTWTSTDYDETARREAVEREAREKTEAVIRAELERQAEVKRKSDEYQRQREAEAAARAAKEAERVAKAEANKRAMEDNRRQAAIREDDRRSAQMNAGDPRCRFFDWENYQRNYQTCINNANAEDARKRQADLDAQNKAAAEAAFRNQQQQINTQLMTMNPNTCEAPYYNTAGVPTEQAHAIQTTIHNAWQQCMQRKQGMDAQRIAAENAQRQAQQRAEQQMLEAQQRAQAQAQAQAQLSAAVNDAQQSTNSMRQTSRGIQNDNAALEAFLRGN